VPAGDIDLTSQAALITALTLVRAADSSGRVRIDMAACASVTWQACDHPGRR